MTLEPDPIAIADRSSQPLTQHSVVYIMIIRIARALSLSQPTDAGNVTYIYI
jgi:hypothetical protein